MKTSSWRATLLAGFLVSGLLACTEAPATDSERVALGAAIHRWMSAVNAQDVSTLTTTMTEDVELLDDAATVTGREAAIRALSDVTQGRLVETTRELTIADDVAWHVVGLARVQKNGVVQEAGQALEIWRRLKGEWQLHRRMTNGAVGREDLLTRPSTKEPVLDRPGN